MKAHPNRRFSWLIAASLGLGACGPLVELPSGGPAPALYSLNRAGAPAGLRAAAPIRLMIEEPATAPELASDRIARRSGETEVQYYAGARWSGPLSRLVRDRLVEAFENTPGVMALSR
ncbi:MAG: ABC transporter, partial [Alphaproteobacteria bacterium]